MSLMEERYGHPSRKIVIGSGKLFEEEYLDITRNPAWRLKMGASNNALIANINTAQSVISLSRILIMCIANTIVYCDKSKKVLQLSNHIACIRSIPWCFQPTSSHEFPTRCWDTVGFWIVCGSLRLVVSFAQIGRIHVVKWVGWIKDLIIRVLIHGKASVGKELTCRSTPPKAYISLALVNVFVLLSSGASNLFVVVKAVERPVELSYTFVNPKSQSWMCGTFFRPSLLRESMITTLLWKCISIQRRRHAFITHPFKITVHELGLPCMYWGRWGEYSINKRIWHCLQYSRPSATSIA